MRAVGDGCKTNDALFLQRSISSEIGETTNHTDVSDAQKCQHEFFEFGHFRLFVSLFCIENNAEAICLFESQIGEVSDQNSAKYVIETFQMKDNEKRHHKSEQKQGCNGGSKPDEKFFGHEDNFGLKVGKLPLYTIHFVGEKVNELLPASNIKEPKSTLLKFWVISHVFQTRRIRRL